MCRFLLYKSNSPILLADLLTRPAHSIIMQSFNCKLRLDMRRPMNGDGFGIGWFDEPRTQGCIFTSTLPAWSNLNLQRLAEKIKSALVFAHVRATTGDTATSESNCHPWQYGNLMWMHNGNIGGFDRIKRQLQNALSEEIYLSIQGTTDSEHAFALFLNMLDQPRTRVEFTYQELRRAMLDTIAQINEWLDEAGVDETSLMNFAVTDGQTVVCTRYITSCDLDAASLFYSSGSEFKSEADSGQYRMVKANKREDVVVVASEPLTYERSDWLAIPTNTLLVITPKLNVHLYPIHDKYWNPHRRQLTG
ncbi:glutamine amidotransferase subunit [Coemansia sp. RSA 2523]|nr:glutamine amidotransferase subunit [Coemansia sp. RSA 1591]KAJ1762555.1 glutamine amidotransferase subunit [Coemansia sp. RSA 1752]KAJ1777932.1 glutamine amidotransferase subunit [Coemansia sp. RSA 1824]KAJ1786878.1 glutamine amidotransferase subunit [Coemansia sp. RSA 1938]KAJ1792733.1 glutamine amidotransferase subunit [Coemansia sp. RSA 2167]KAJ1808206.1 glutamine amidotransferase subunit [Coemansia sp. RSA 2523]KAJ2133003.1 glutamine amidotransferase subunit [Coemansia sp. RSA 921]KAJ